MAKKKEPLMKLTIEMDKNGIVHERTERSGELTKEQEEKFWELAKRVDSIRSSHQEFMKTFDILFGS